MNKLMKLFALATIATGLCSAQTILSTTTLGAAITSTSGSANTITLASSSTMLSAGASNQINTVLYVDQELMNVLTVVDSTHVTVKRGAGAGIGARPTTHVNGATVWFSITAGGNTASSLFSSTSGPENWGSCTATSLLVLPRINVFFGDKSDCIGGQWVRTDAPGYPLLATGVTIPAGVWTPTGTISITDTGTAAMTGIAVANGLSPGMCLTVIPGGAFTWTTASNIRTSGTAVANKVLLFCYDGTKFDASE